MKSFTVGEFKALFAAVLKEVQAGHPIAITYGKKRQTLAVLVPFDVLLALKDGDSLDWRTTSGTENVMRRVDVPVMRHTTRATDPFSYPQRTQSTRSGPRETGRASHAGELFAHWDAGTSKPNGFVVQLVPDHTPASIIRRFGKACFGQLDTGHVTHGDQFRAAGNSGRDLMRPVLPGVLNLRLHGGGAFLFPGTLRHGQCGFMVARQVLTAVDHAIRTRNLLRQAQVNAYFRMAQRVRAVCNRALQVDVPTATGVLREAPGFDRACHWTRQPQAEGAPKIHHSIADEFNGTDLERHPTQRALATAPFQTMLAMPRAGFRILQTDFVDRIAMQPKFLPNSSTQSGKIKARQPFAITPPGKQRHPVAVVPDGVHGPRHAQKICAVLTIFDAVLVGDNRHAPLCHNFLMSQQLLHLTASGTVAPRGATFLPPRPKRRGFQKGRL